MRVLVVGASGFLGRHLLPLLAGGGNEVVALARRPPAAAPGLLPLAGDALEPATLERAMAGCRAVVNLVGINHPRDAQTYERMHVELAGAMATAAGRANVERLVQLSVFSARPDPLSPYHDTKWRGDEAIMRGPVPWVVLRPAIVYGPDDAFTTRIKGLITTRVVPLPDGGKALHAPTHVDDVAQAIAQAVTRPGLAGQVLPLCGARTLSYRQIVRELIFRSGKRALTPSVPVALVRLAARLTSWMRDPPITAAQLTMLTDGMAADTSASWAALGIETRGFDVAQL
jgi:NADH dehydrogenase